MGALEAFRDAVSEDPGSVSARLGLGRAHLLLGHPARAREHGERALQLDPREQEAMDLVVRSLLRSRQFEEALATCERFLARVATPGPELLAAHGSALFRVQRCNEAASAYRRVLALDPLHGEAHLRLGSGLTPPVAVLDRSLLTEAVRALEAGGLDRAITDLRGVLAADPVHPIAHRLIGDALFLKRSRRAMAAHDPAFAALRAALPPARTPAAAAYEFLPDLRSLAGARAEVARRALAMFASRLPRLLTLGGRHDLLDEIERTTDAPARRSLRGRRTFDGRVWDDVRGIGGLRAATGVEALDEAALMGFDTLVHEIAHQVHFYGCERRLRLRIRTLYREAKAEGRFLDYYAASNEAEYFAQGVEAFVALGKRPGIEPTHGHTRFELARVDPELHEFIAELVDVDPLDSAGGRARILPAAVAVALRCGRPEDGVTAAAMMAPGPDREALLAEARRARMLAQSF